MELKLAEFKKNILLWYPFKNNCSVLNLGNSIDDFKDELGITFERFDSFSDVDNSVQYDYVIIIGEYSLDFERKLTIALKHLKKDGKILIALNNRLGLNNLNTNGNLYRSVSRRELEELFKLHKIKYSKFYYVFPNYENTNLIYNEDYKLTEEDISRNFAVYDKDLAVNFNENEVYSTLLKEGEEFVNKFVNSFFIELSNSSIKTDVKYVSYSNYRKEKLRTMTVLTSKNVIKKATNETSMAHVEEIKDNIENLRRDGITVLEEFDGNKLVSKYISGKRYDVEMQDANTIDEFKKKFEIIKTILDKNTISYEDLKEELNKENKEFKECIKRFDENKLKNMKFLRKAYIDLIPKNCFLIHGKINVFDQEWVIENIPVEYIYYRAIINTPNSVRKFGFDNLLNAFGIYEYLGLFQELEKDFTESVFDKEIHEIYFRQYANTREVSYMAKKFKDRSSILEKKVTDLEEEKRLLNLELEDARGKLVAYANELRYVGKSPVWKIALKLKSIGRIINIFNGLNYVERFYPVGTKRRELYDKKRIQKEFVKIKKELANLTDKATYKYWEILEKKYLKRREEIEKDIKDSYQIWIKENGMTLEKMINQRNLENNFDIKPKISIIIPLYNTPVDLFRELLFTVECQSYSNWELCLADGSKEELTEIKKMCSKDSRIKYKFIGENKGISGNSNEALKLATGDYISLLDHDDLLEFDALFEIVKCINENSEVEFIYTDEDKIENLDSKRYDPDFKPDYAPDTLRSGNYITHFSTIKKDLMDKLGGFRSECDGAQDFDIILRVTELAGSEKIKHIPKILYHWRICEGSTAGNSGAKLYAYESGEKALKDHLERVGLNGIVKMRENYRGYYDIEYELKDNPKVNILIVNKKNDYGVLAKCIEYILEKTTYSNYEIDIIDSGSDEPGIISFYNKICENNKIKVLKYEFSIAENPSYSKLINKAVNQIDGEYIVELERFEKVLTPDWIQKMLQFAERKDVGCVGGKVYYIDNLIKSGGMVYGISDYSAYLYRHTETGYKMRDKIVCNASVISGLCRMFRKNVFKEVSGMNENIDFELINEVDFSLRLRNKGYLNVYTPFVELQEIIRTDEREEISEDDKYDYRLQVKKLKEDWKIFFEKTDPYYNPNFNKDFDFVAIYTGEVKY